MATLNNEQIADVEAMIQKPWYSRWSTRAKRYVGIEWGPEKNFSFRNQCLSNDADFMAETNKNLLMKLEVKIQKKEAKRKPKTNVEYQDFMPSYPKKKKIGRAQRKRRGQQEPVEEEFII